MRSYTRYWGESSFDAISRRVKWLDWKIISKYPTFEEGLLIIPLGVLKNNIFLKFYWMVDKIVGLAKITLHTNFGKIPTCSCEATGVFRSVDQSAYHNKIRHLSVWVKCWIGVTSIQYLFSLASILIRYPGTQEKCACQTSWYFNDLYWINKRHLTPIIRLLSWLRIAPAF